MRLLLILGFVLALFTVSPPLAAQSVTPEAVPPKMELSQMTRGQVIAVGAGAVLGVFVAHAIIPGEFSFLIGSVGGGLLADWWYNNGGSESLRASINYAPVQEAALSTKRILHVRMTR